MLASLAALALAVAPPVHSANAVKHLPGCPRPERNTPRMRHLCARAGRRWWRRHHPQPAPRTIEALASWYAPGGPFACGGTYEPGAWGVANKELPCGTMVTLTYGRATVRVPVVDRGPFVAGRTFDLTEAVKEALGCSDLCDVRYRVG